MKEKLTTIGTVLLVALLLLVSGCTQQEYGQKFPQKGRAVFLITDAAMDMQSVNKVEVTVQSVQVHSATEGWVTVSSVPKTYDLLELKSEAAQKVIADVQLDEGTYNEIRMEISNVVVHDDTGTHFAKLPSAEIKIKGNLEVGANSTSTATFDFIADESLHLTGKGEYVMAPVIRVETRDDADVTVATNSKAEVKGGTVRTSIRIGMDASGNVGVGVKIPGSAVVSINNGIVVVGSSATTGNGTAESRTEVDVSIK